MSSTVKGKSGSPGPLKAAGKLTSITADYDSLLFGAKDKGRLIAYVTSMVPVEILQAFDIVLAMPENYAALCASRKMAGEFCNAAEQMGYSGVLCSYMLTTSGSESSQKGPYEGNSLPPPDLLVCSDYACNTHVKWWQNLSEYYGCPIFVIDSAYSAEGPLREHYRDYLVSEFRGLIAFLQEHTGKSLDMQRLKETVALSDRASALWEEIGEYRKVIPTPIGPIDIFTTMLTLVLLRGTREAVDFYEEVVDEIKERVKDKIAYLPNEKFRLIWDRFPVWYRLGLLKLFEDNGAVVVTDLYADAFGGRLDPDNPLPSLAERYLNLFARSAAGGRADMYIQRAKDWHVDGAVFHSNRACRYASTEQLMMAHIMEKELGIPTMFFEGNMNDPRMFSEAQAVTRIQAFIEILENQRESSGKG